jgi:hypothetical protein
MAHADFASMQGTRSVSFTIIATADPGQDQPSRVHSRAVLKPHVDLKPLDVDKKINLFNIDIPCLGGEHGGGQGHIRSDLLAKAHAAARVGIEVHGECFPPAINKIFVFTGGSFLV